MKRLQRWHDKIKYMPAEPYFDGLAVYCALITLALTVAYLATNDGIYMWPGLLTGALAVLCLEKAADARRTARNKAHEQHRGNT